MENCLNSDNPLRHVYCQDVFCGCRCHWRPEALDDEDRHIIRGEN